MRPGVRHGPRLLPRPARALAALKLGVEILEIGTFTHHYQWLRFVMVVYRDVVLMTPRRSQYNDINDPGYLLYINQLLVEVHQRFCPRDEAVKVVKQAEIIVKVVKGK